MWFDGLNWMAGGRYEQPVAIISTNIPSKPNVVTVPGNPGDEVPKGTLKSILKAADLEAKQ